MACFLRRFLVSLHLYGSREKSKVAQPRGKESNLSSHGALNDSAEKIRAQEGTLSQTFHVAINSFLIRKQSLTYVPFNSTQGISTNSGTMKVELKSRAKVAHICFQMRFHARAAYRRSAWCRYS